MLKKLYRCSEMITGVLIIESKEGDSDFEIQKSKLVLKYKMYCWKVVLPLCPQASELNLFKGAPSSRRSFRSASLSLSLQV